ncbi:unnamed protein product [Paramecium octaurelia]|uniref:Uncharacterized protein n=1 Tax=Paramecium octaurelia TaxID=43137 RepID=A0A8S1TC90_PAROT|nr:unnamed protein product [Paramecium octaurelia]
MKHYKFILILLCLANAQEQWDIIYQSFQDTNTMDASGWIVSNNYNGNLFSNCNGFRLFGGADTFAAKTKISKRFSLPPHYKLNVTLEFWKVDSWDDEYVYIIVDDKLFSKLYTSTDGSYLCGYRWIDAFEPITLILDHTSESLVFITTTNLNQDPKDESWGIRDFTLSILKCPSGCFYCLDNDYNNCFKWISFLSLWHVSMLLDGWMKNDNIQPATSQCVSFDLVGGYLNLAPNDKLEKTIQNLSFHHKIHINLQLWKIDKWNNENFELLVDDKIQNQTVLGTLGFYSICGSTGQEKMVNIAVTLSHSSTQCKITMRTNRNAATTNAYWGIRAFNLYFVSNCYNGCDLCLGPLKTDCTACSRGWVFYNNLCINSPFILLSQILINHIKDPKSDERIPMEINLLEVNQQIVTQGTFTQTINNNLQILTILVYAKCFPNKKMNSYFIKCLQCQSQNQKQFSHYCYPTINSILYNVRFQLSEQELIINTSNTECSIYQVVDVGGELIQIKVLEILQQDV